MRWPFGQDRTLLVTEIDIAPASFAAYPNEPLRLRFENVGAGSREVTIALGEEEANLLRIGPLGVGESSTIEIRAPHAPGLYPYWSPQIADFQGSMEVAPPPW